MIFIVLQINKAGKVLYLFQLIKVGTLNEFGNLLKYLTGNLFCQLHFPFGHA